MSRTGILLVLTGSLLVTNPAVPQAQRAKAPAKPKLEPVAETQLLMDGLNQANFRGLEKLLKEKPADAESWTYARGQALLIAETGNLLMLRPPRNRGQDAWMDRAADLRDSATTLARAAGRRDFERSRATLGELAKSCNRCHQTFRVRTRVTPFAGDKE
jgi:cytochrome c556